MVGHRGRPDDRGGLAWRSGRVEVSDGFLAYHHANGPGPALVLSHGLTDNGLCWSRLAEALAGVFDIILLDARGHGASSRIPEAAMWDPALDIAEAIDGLQLSRPIVIGHSVGARATAAFAAAFPDRPAKVILEDPPFLPLANASEIAHRRARFRRQVEQLQDMSEADLFALGRSTHPTWGEDEFPAWVAAKTQVDRGALPAYAAPWQADIAGIAVPTLLVYGDPAQGGIVTPDLAAEAVAENANIRAVHVPAAGHNIRRENFADFHAAVRDFLTSP